MSAVMRLSVPQYHAMIRNGMLTSGDRVELLDGYLVEKMTVNPLHRRAVRKMRDALQRILPPGWYDDSQQPITLPTSEPEPDNMIVRGQSTDDYPYHNPGPSDLGLVVEIADSSLAQDRQLKLPIYAASRIEVYWIFNLPAQQIEVCTQPNGVGDDAGYDHVQIFGVTETVPVVLDGVEVGRVAVAEVLPV